MTLIGVTAAQVCPGPNLMAVASAGLGQGRRSALLVTLGISTGMLIWAVAVSYGLGSVFTTYPISLVALKLMGGSYLLWLAVRAFLSARTNTRTALISDPQWRSDMAQWKSGLLVVLTNPKAALMWSSIAIFLFGSGLDTWQVALFGPVGAVSGSLIYGAYAILFSTGAAIQLHHRYSAWFELVFSAAFALLGARLLFDGAHTLW